MNSLSFLKQCVSEVIVEPVSEVKLRCTICGGHAKGKQWWNQDKGQGICGQCAAKMKADGKEDIGQSYGKEGTHYFIKESISRPSPRRQVGSVYVKSGQYAGKTVYAFEDETKGLYYTYNMDTGTDVCIGDASNLSFQSKPTINLVKECLAEVMDEDPLYVEYVSQRQGEVPFMMRNQKYEYVNAKYPNGKIDIGVYAFAGDMVYGYNAFRQMMGIKESKTSQLVKECVLEVLKENLCEGGYDPQSQAGPNVPMENPYPQWNSQMAKMEEDNTATAADFDEPQSWKKKGQKVQITFFKNGKNETQIGVIKEPQTTQAIVKPDKGYNTIVVPWKYIKPLMNAQFGVNETEGRYAQTAGAGQFDPRTFGVNGEIDDVTETNGPTSDSTGVQWQCPHCKKETQIPIEIESPSDYIACADCEHCCKEIADPRLDAKIYECVISHFAGECSPTLKG